MALGDAGYQGIEERPDARPEVDWHIAMRPGKHCALNKQDQVTLIGQGKKVKASARVKVEHPFRASTNNAKTPARAQSLPQSGKN